jgi:hypothetical protein
MMYTNPIMRTKANDKVGENGKTRFMYLFFEMTDNVYESNSEAERGRMKLGWNRKTCVMYLEHKMVRIIIIKENLFLFGVVQTPTLDDFFRG